MVARKKEDERNSLVSATEIGKSEGTEETKNIMSLFDSVDFSDEECPDFIGMNQEEKIMFGIEHFRIDHFITEKRNHQVGATGVMYKKEIAKVYSTWRDEVLTSDKVPDGAIKDIMNIVTNQLERALSASYRNFICSFKHVLGKHIEHLDRYWERLKLNKIETQTIKMSFLMEIYTDFHGIYLNYHNRTEKNVLGLMPFFEEVLDLLSQVPKDKVQYFILYIKNYNGSISRVIALDNNDLMESIRRQKLKVYKYAGIDYFLDSFQSLHGKTEFVSDYKRRNGQINMNYKISTQFLKPEIYQFLIFNATKLALEAKNMGKPFVCDSLSQRMLYVYGDHIKGWKRIPNNDSYIYEPVIRPMKETMIQRRNDEFDRMYKTENEQFTSFD